MSRHLTDQQVQFLTTAYVHYDELYEWALTHNLPPDELGKHAAVLDCMKGVIYACLRSQETTQACESANPVQLSVDGRETEKASPSG